MAALTHIHSAPVRSVEKELTPSGGVHDKPSLSPSAEGGVVGEPSSGKSKRLVADCCRSNREM